ncbi:unnamed protein product [Brassica oleracea]
MVPFIQLNECLITKPRILCTWTVLMNDKTEDVDDDLAEDFHGDDMPASDCNLTTSVTQKGTVFFFWRKLRSINPWKFGTTFLNYRRNR